MPALKTGSTGAQVTRLQTRLKELGFKPGKIDGKFGPATKAAVIAFQKSRKLKADGIVGPKTMAALKPKAKPAVAKVPDVLDLSKVTAVLVSKMFPGTPIANIGENLPLVLEALVKAKLADKDMVLMALATIRAETENFTPLSEFRSKFNTSPGSHPFNLYDDRADLGNKGRPDGANFRGRGYIQLTGRSNYAVHGAAIGLGNQLIENPALANQPEIAAKLLASFLKSKEDLIRKALLAGDLRTARRLVNGGSHGLGVFTQAFKTGKELLK
ncbi:MAG: peptidoglycan-binding protein [Pyrinomonadaceae bacterium]